MSSPLSQYTEHNNVVYVSGQVGIDLDNNAIPAEFEQQAKNMFANLEARLHEVNLKKDNVLKTTVYMTDLSLFEKMNEIYSNYFEDHKPARTVIGVSALPQFAGDPFIHIEIDAIAAR